jgi:hypothetical protein
MFGSIDPVIVGWDEVDVHVVASVVCFDNLGAFVVHYVECGCIPAGVEVGKNSVNAAIMAPSFLDGMAQARMAFRL